MCKTLGLLAILFANCAFAQEKDSTQLKRNFLSDTVAKPDNLVSYKVIDLDDDLDDQLISLADIIEVAKRNSPMLQAQVSTVQSNHSQVEFTKQQWTQNISGSASYYQGNNSQVTFLNNEQSTTGSTGSGLRYGVQVVVPLSDFTARKRRVDMYKYQEQASRSRLEELDNALTREVIAEYSKLISNQRSLRIQASSREQAKVQVVNAEKDYKSGNISVMEYTNLCDFYTKAQLDFEFWRKEFYSSYYQFEVLVGVKMKDLLKKK